MGIPREPHEVYRWLMAEQVGDPFDAHVLASVLALACGETEAAGGRLAEGMGLNGAELVALAAPVFPHAAAWLRVLSGDDRLARSEEELYLLDVLRRHGSRGTPFEARLSSIMARRALRPNHLWQDLGLGNRGELSRLIEVHFAPLARRNARDMKWKKFLYRMICRDQDYRLCTAPSCSECDDFETCFGEEGGESLLARSRRSADLAARR